MPKSEDTNALKVVPLYEDHDGGDEDQDTPVFLAAEKDGAGYKMFTPRAPLCWWSRKDEKLEKWERIPDEALVEDARHRRIVRLLLPRLQRLEGYTGSILIGVSASSDVDPDTGARVRIGTNRPSRLPFPIEGKGSGGGATTPEKRVAVQLSRTHVPNTPEEILQVVIRNSARSLGFDQYQEYMDALFCHPNLGRVGNQDKQAVAAAMEMPIDLFAFSSVDAYRVLRIATEVFVMTNCGVVRQRPLKIEGDREEGRFSHSLASSFSELWEKYLEPGDRLDGRRTRVLPYLALIRKKLGDVTSVRSGSASIIERQAGLLQEKLLHPCMLELIWSYWMEEGMLVQAFNSITRRFQNVRSGERDPLANLELDPLRPLNNLLWGWIQDEQSQLSVLRRAHEYDHQYGFTLHGKALSELRTADRRSKFLESFHNLLWKCWQFYQKDDDTTVIADGFSILNALKETHYVLAHGAHNQFGNLPSTARQEMLMQQWILSRPEMREFLGTRVMVPYPEPWMDRVDAVKTLKGWTDTSVVHFRDLAVFGEQILLSVRWGAWSVTDDPNSASNWARYWRAEVQGYMHAYRAATSVDLTAEITDQRQAETRFLAPSVHLRNRLLSRASR